jgi:alanyl-tRNA synthetase
MLSKEIRKKFRDFFEKHDHKWVGSSSLIPDDPSVLLTTAGMQQFKKYYTGELNAEKDFGKKNTASAQKCFRTSDIDEVGDESHLTFFEMFGNFSFGGYWKDEAIKLAHEFITKEIELPISYVTVFRGEHGVPEDKESEKIWKSLGVADIRKEGMEDVFWGPTGTAGPCGPTTEIYCKSKNGKDVEIWNIVFNEFLCDGSRDALLKGGAKLKPLATRGIDTGMGFERLAMVSQGVPTIFETDLFQEIIDGVEINVPWHENNTENKRVVADHIRGIAFLISDGVRPSNKEAGYVLRRLIRRVIAYGVESSRLLEMVVRRYKDFYTELDFEKIRIVFDEEAEKFTKTLRKGIHELESLRHIDAKTAFDLYQSFGLPYETIKQVGRIKADGLRREDFDKELEKHKEISRAGQEKKFGGHGLILNTGELKAGNEEELNKVLRLHTATHLLQGALREVLGDNVHQAGSDITPERTRFDFSFPRKMTLEEIKKVEEVMNQKIKEDLPVGFKEMSKAEAEKIGALHFFKEKYPEKVKVYFVGYTIESAWSKEFCGGPHVTHTGEIGKFRIAKEEAVGAGVRRVRGVLAG